jgi:hypothetical protein
MNTFKSFFGTYIDCSGLPEDLLSGELQQMQINAKKRAISSEILFTASSSTSNSLRRGKAYCQLQAAASVFGPHSAAV